MPGNGRPTVDHLHQILIREGFELPDTLPPVFQANATLLRDTYPDAAYRLWSGNALREVIAANFEPAVLEAYDTLRPFAYKSDLGRFCLLYLYGGLYVDMPLRMVNPLELSPRAAIAVCRDLRFCSPNWTALSTSLIWARPGRREFRIAIDLIIENCRNRFYGANALYPTGPVLFGHALAAAAAEKWPSAAADEQWIGDLARIEDTRNLCWITPDNSLIALSMKRTGVDLSEFGTTGTNRYNDFWALRNVYGEDRSVWTSDLSAIHCNAPARRTDTGIAIPVGQKGIAVYGPYVEIEPGHYQVTLSFSPGASPSNILVAVTAQNGHKVIFSERCRVDQGAASSQVDFIFEAPEHLSRVEFPLHVFGDFEGEFRQVTLQRIDPPRPTRSRLRAVLKMKKPG